MRSIGLGVPAYHRAWGLLLGDKLPLETMLSGNYSKLTPEKRESLYGRGWLLVRSLPKGFGPPTMRSPRFIMHLISRRRMRACE